MYPKFSPNECETHEVQGCTSGTATRSGSGKRSEGACCPGPVWSFPDTSRMDEPPPLQVFLSYAIPATRKALSSLWIALTIATRLVAKITVAATRPLLTVVRVLLAPFLFLLSPIIYAAQITLDVLFWKPYAIISTAGSELSDVWVFVGVALAFGILFGFATRILARGLIQRFIDLQPNRTSTAIGSTWPAPTETARPTKKGNAETLLGRAAGAERVKGRRKEWRRVR
jgi:hypothetical protein